jgi:hypothetical protein
MFSAKRAGPPTGPPANLNISRRPVKEKYESFWVHNRVFRWETRHFKDGSKKNFNAC